MSYRLKKRKNRPYEFPGTERHEQLESQPDPMLFIQAHEADLVRGPQAAAAACSLEVFRGEGKKLIVGESLICWNGQPRFEANDVFPEDDVNFSGHQRTSGDAPKDDEGIWVDRYDARLLLESLPDVSAQSASTTADPSPPGGWSDLPSDVEDTFFFSPGEAEDYRREKRRRLIDRDREARLQALRIEAGNEEESDPQEEWGGSDEEPDDAQRELMRRTASHILTSPNPAQLEMRILANHGADARFAFLRGRWSRAWRLAKAKSRLELEAEKKRKENDAKQIKAGSIGGLAGYGDSDEEDDDRDEEDDGKDLAHVDDAREGTTPTVPNDDSAQEDVQAAIDGPVLDNDALKAARRARAREWAEKRRAAKRSGEKESECE